MARKQFACADPADRIWLQKLGIVSLRTALSFREGRVATVNKSSDTRQIPAADAGGPDTIFLKRYWYGRFSSIVSQAFRGAIFGKSRARFEYDMLLEMRRRGVPAVRPIAYGEKRKSGILQACCLITAGEPNSESLDTYALRRFAESSISIAEARRFIDELARAVRKMHQAGVMHAGLFWRNILVRETANNGWEFAFLDPDPKGRLFDGPVPAGKLAPELSQLFADAAATECGEIQSHRRHRFSRRTAIVRFARAYFGKNRLGPDEKTILYDAARLAKPLLDQARHRLAMGDTIKRLQKHVEKDTGGDDRATFDSVQAFLDTLAQKKLPKNALRGKNAVVHLTFHNTGETAETIKRSLTIGAGHIVVDQDHRGQANLTIETDAKVWLAIVNGQADAFDLIRSHQLQIEGNTALLAELARLIEI